MNANYSVYATIVPLVSLFSGVIRALNMRVILQNRKSLLYFKSANEWTSHIKDATNFQGVVKAFDYVNKTRLPLIDVVMHFGDPIYDVRLRVGD